jgi:nitroreductase
MGRDAITLHHTHFAMSDSETLIPLDFIHRPPEEVQQRARDFYDVMRRRRSVRSYAREAVPVEVIEYAIRTAGSAPSGANKQPWHFCVIGDASLKACLREAVEAEEKENYERRFSEEMKRDIAAFQTDFNKPHLTDAPFIIVVFKQNFRVDAEGYRHKNYYVNESVGIACGMLIAALHQAGLATLTHTPNPMKFLNEMLGRPKNETPVMVLPVGYPAAGTRVPDNRRKPLSEMMSRF